MNIKNLLYNGLFVFSAVLFTACPSSTDDIDDNNGGGGTTSSNANANTTAQNKDYGRLEFPHLSEQNSIVVIHYDGNELNYSVEWDYVKKSQRWSCYQLYKSNMQKNTQRYYPGDDNYVSSQYPYDPDLPRSYYFSKDPYWNTGYDHGHICPSADRLNTENANYQTFYLTNMQPQRNDFNAKVWANMEAFVRNVASRNAYRFCDTLYVCKGGTIDNQSQILQTLSSGLIVPKYFFMALLAVKNGQYHAMGFWVEHKANSDTHLSKYALTISALQKKTGIDFFCNLPDSREAVIESTPISDSYWGLN